MRALRIDEGSLTLADVPEPIVAEGDALVRVRLAGICGTDLELVAGYKGFRGVPGHEVVGEIVACASDPGLVGTRVVPSINSGCGHCPMCVAAGEGHCPDRRVLGLIDWPGALAERFAAPVANLHVVPDGVSDAAAVFAEPLAAAVRIARQVDVDERRVIVVGAGRLGLLCALALDLEGALVTVVARSERAASILRGAGIDVVSSADELRGDFDVAVDATGAPEGLALTRRLVRPRGTLVLKSTCAPGAGAPPLDPTSLVVDEITVVGSRCGSIAEALEILGARALDPTPLIDAVIPLAEGVRAFERAARPGALKVLVAPEE